MFYSIAVVNKENKEHLHLRGQQPCKFCETKERVYLTKEFKYPQDTVLWNILQVCNPICCSVVNLDSLPVDDKMTAHGVVGATEDDDDRRHQY